MLARRNIACLVVGAAMFMGMWGDSDIHNPWGDELPWGVLGSEVYPLVITSTKHKQKAQARKGQQGMSDNEEGNDDVGAFGLALSARLHLQDALEKIVDAQGLILDGHYETRRDALEATKAMHELEQVSHTIHAILKENRGIISIEEAKEARRGTSRAGHNRAGDSSPQTGTGEAGEA